MLPSLENMPKRLVLKVLLSLDNITLLLINTSVNTRKLLAILPMNSLLRPLINSLVLFHNIGYTRSNSYKDPQHAQIVKKNYLNWYGVGIIAGSFFGALLFLRRLRYYISSLVRVILIVLHCSWLLNISALRAFLAATSLGAYGTLAAITALTNKDPLGQVGDKVIRTS